MQPISTTAAVTAPPDPATIRAARVATRLAVSRPVADLLARLIYGDRGRDHLAMVGAVTAHRCAEARP